MKGKVLMVQGTASHAGKSMLVTALCRILRQDGYRVAPFKAQNMSLNSGVTPDGLEIGRAQVVQAEAAGVEPMVDMNPVLLKPEADSRSQVVVRGRPFLTTSAADYYKLKSQLWTEVTRALDSLCAQYEVVVIEGAGSPAEINLRRDEIVNMRVARYCNAPVLLVGDIDRGGVFASLLGTLWLLEPDERALIKATVINKFRGDISLLEEGLRFLEEKAGIPVAGVIPYYRDIYIADEDSVSLEQAGAQRKGSRLDVAVLRLPHISNFDDFDPLRDEDGVDLRYVSSTREIGVPDLIIIPGSKTTVADLDWLAATGLAEEITRLHRQGIFIIGICGGYQMLGTAILDPHRVESSIAEKPGLGLLPVKTTFLLTKQTHRVKGEVVAGNTGLFDGALATAFQGYEIHMAKTEVPPGTALFRIRERSGQSCDQPDGCLSGDGRVAGTYVHGIFHNHDIRQAILKNVAARRERHIEFQGNSRDRDAEYDKLAALVRGSLNMGLVYDITGLR